MFILFFFVKCKPEIFKNMKAINYLIFFLFFVMFSSNTSIEEKEMIGVGQSSVSLILEYQGGVGLIKSVELGDYTNQFYALRLKVHAAVERVRIDWHTSDDVYTKTYFPTLSSNYVDIPTFLTDDFVISVSATNVSADMSDISTRYETRRYKVIR